VSRVAVVIVSAFEPPVSVVEAVDRVLEQSVPPGEVVLVDNNPSGVLAAVLAEHRSVRVISPASNLGYAPACDLAVRSMEAEWVLFLNPDAVPAPNLIEQLLGAASDLTGIVGAQVLLADGAVNAGDNPLHLSGLSWSGRFMEQREHGPPRPVAVASGAALMVRRADFLHVGGYHRSYFLYHDDVDLCWRMRIAGREVRFVPEATVVHSYEFEKGNYKKWFWLERNRLWTVLSNYDRTTLWLLSPLLIATELGVSFLAIRDGWWREKVRAWRDLWRQRSELRRWRTDVQALRVAPDRELVRLQTANLDTPLIVFPARRSVNALLRAYSRALDSVLATLG
jgi:GT2 family glycosyltransferase